MNFIDYREKLKIGFTDEQKLEMLRNKISNMLKNTPFLFIDQNDIFSFYHMLGYKFDDTLFSFDPEYTILPILNDADSLKEYISIYIAFVNTFRDKPNDKHSKRKNLCKMLTDSLVDLKIPYELKKEGKEYYHFPKGAKELDDALVSQPLAWLEDYPAAHKAFVNALRQYAEGIFVRDVADNFRKSLEDFLKEFFNNTKNLSNNINELGTYLRNAGIDSEITNIYVGLCKAYDMLNNKVAKHNDKVDPKYLEFFMYQTGLFIRMIIVVKKSENTLQGEK